MLPPGHIAAGFLVAKAVIMVAHPAISAEQQNSLLFWGAFFGFLPDIDMFYAFFKVKGFTFKNDAVNHREFISHAPLVWFVASCVLFVFAPTLYIKYIAIIMWFGTWSHFILDSYETGVRWLYPFNKKLYALKSFSDISELFTNVGFWKFWWNFVRYYAAKMSLLFYTEIFIIIIAVVVYRFGG